MSTLPLPYTPPGQQSIVESRESDRNSDVTRLINDLNITPPGSEIKEQKNENKVYLL